MFETTRYKIEIDPNYICRELDMTRLDYVLG